MIVFAKAIKSNSSLLKLITIVIIYFLLSTACLAQNHTPEFCLDIGQFKFDGRKNLVEIYYNIARNSLTFEKQDSILVAKFKIMSFIVENSSFEDSLCFFDTSKEAIVPYGKNKLKITALDTLLLEDKIFLSDSTVSMEKILQITRTAVDRGYYELIVALKDLNSCHYSVLQRSFEVQQLSSSDLCLSDIELGYLIAASDDSVQEFYKNGYRILPNSCLKYGMGFDKVYLYCEIYNLEQAKKRCNFDLHFAIRDGYGRAIISQDQWCVESENDIVSVVNVFDIKELSPGIYRLEVEVEDNLAGKKARVKKAFYIAE